MRGRIIRHIHPLNVMWHGEGLAPLFMNAVVREVAMVFVALFSPVYIFVTFRSKGFSDIDSIGFLLLYYAILLTTKLVVLFFSEDLSRRVGFKHTMILSTFPFVLFVPALVLFAQHLWGMVVAAFFAGMAGGLYWWGYHGYFVKAGKRKHYGSSVGGVNVLLIAVAVLAPIVGAYIGDGFGFVALFIFSGLLYVISMVVLGESHDRRQHADIKVSEFMSVALKHKVDLIPYIGLGGYTIVYTSLWPVFLYLYFDGLVELGLVVSLAALAASVASLLSGRYVDKVGERLPVTVGSLVLAVSWVARIFFASISFFVAADTLFNLGDRTLSVAMDEWSYKKANEGGTAAAMLFREVGLIVGMLLVIVIAYAIVSVELDMKYVFGVGLIFSLLPLVAVYKRKL